MVGVGYGDLGSKVLRLVRAKDLVCSLGDMDVPVYIVALVAMMLDQMELLSTKIPTGLARSGLFL